MPCDGWLLLKDANDRPLPVTMEDISVNRAGLSFVGQLLWTLHENRAGAEFVNRSTIDADVLDEWLQRT
jgi:hypothetical protein